MTPALLITLLEQRARELAQRIAVPGRDGLDGRSIKGDKGDPGKDGIGLRGYPGRDGDDGLSIKGDPGKDGKDGKDASAVKVPQPADVVKPAKSWGIQPDPGDSDDYSRGNHAHGTPPAPAVGGGGGGGVHPNLTVHTVLGLATQAGLDAHAATSHGGTHPDLAAHDTLGLATQAELDARVPIYIQDTEPAIGVFLWVNTVDDTLWYHDGVIS